jgi:hypothetical protein
LTPECIAELKKKESSQVQDNDLLCKDVIG